MPPTVLLLDIDGTLIDNTRQHIDAWRDAFKRLGLEVDEESLRRNIGKGGDLYVSAIAGEVWERKHGDEARRIHGEAYKQRLGQVRGVPDARDFLHRLGRTGIRPVLATSSNPDEVAANLGVIGEKRDRYLIVDRDDIGRSKPAPDVFAVALERSQVDASQAAALGDTRWDAEAAVKLGVVPYGVLTGAGTSEELRAGGAQRIFDDLRAVLTFLEESS